MCIVHFLLDSASVFSIDPPGRSQEPSWTTDLWQSDMKTHRSPAPQAPERAFFDAVLRLVTGGVRVGGHEDPFSGAVLACLQGACCRLDGAVRVELGCRFPVVPDVSGFVLGVPVGGALAESAVEVAPIVDHDAANPVDHAGAVCDPEYVD